MKVAMTDMVKTSQDINSYVKSVKGWFDVEDEGKGFIDLSTRMHGNVGDEKPGQEDIRKGREIMDKVKRKFPKAQIYPEVVDEWVTIIIKY